MDKPPQTKEQPAGSLCHPPLPQIPVQLPLPTHPAGPCPSAFSFAAFSFISTLLPTTEQTGSHTQSLTHSYNTREQQGMSDNGDNCSEGEEKDNTLISDNIFSSH